MLNLQRVGVLTGIALICSSNVLGAGKPNRAEVVGYIAGIKGSVQLDHQPALPRAVVFAGDVVATGGSSAAVLKLSEGTVATLVENAQLTLSGSQGSANLTLVKGALVVRSSNSQTARIAVPGATVTVQGEGSFPSICSIAAVGRSAVVIAAKGHAEIHGAGAPVIVRSGKTVHLENGVPQGGQPQAAGSVYKEIPQGYVSRSATDRGKELNLSDPVHWDDWVTTPTNGRVQILLGDGSYLNVGARSQMHIIRHDAQSHQTELEIKAGSVFAAVQRVAGKTNFKATTPTAVIGVVGTQLQADVVSADETRVASIEDTVTVGSTNPGITNVVTLNTGQMVTVTHAGFSAVTNLAAGVMNTTTQIAGGLRGNASSTTQNLASARPGGMGGATQTVTTTATTAANTARSAAGVTGTAVGGGTAGAIGAATSSAQAATTTLSSAVTSTAAAASSASSAATAATLAAGAITAAATATTTTATTATTGAAAGCGCVSPSSP